MYNIILLLMDFDIVNKTICLCAKRNSGKSQLMRYIIMMSKHQFKKIFVICPTEQINRFYNGLVDEKNIFGLKRQLICEIEKKKDFLLVISLSFNPIVL